ncbi:hypothetical protein MMC27_006597 [Xylographa pallens]|nr:hypothetical protein [Xylographa pallens]
MDEDDESVTKLDSIFTTILEAPPSCIEWSPSSPDIVVIGTYNLTEPNESSGGAQLRSGSLVTYRLVGKSLYGLSSTNPRLFLAFDVESIPTCAAVLDLHFSPHHPEVLAVATSIGALEIYRLHRAQSISLERLLIVQAFDPTILILSLAWHPSPERSTELAVSCSDGNIALLDYNKNPVTQLVEEAHSLEAWTVSWSDFDGASDDCVLYSGGDDSGLRAFLPRQLISEVRAHDDNTRSTTTAISPVFNTRIHSAGVTAILPIKSANRLTPETILTGSYDEYVRVLALSPKGVWKVLAKKRLGGGVWRLKQIASPEINDMLSPTQGSIHVLASCMHAGARVLQICSTGDETWSIKILCRFEEHESMNYGSDATMLQELDEGEDQPVVIASTSFYDRKLCLWRVPSSIMVSNTPDAMS